MNKNIYIMQGKAKNQSNFYQYKNERITRERIKTKQKIESKENKNKKENAAEEEEPVEFLPIQERKNNKRKT